MKEDDSSGVIEWKIYLLHPPSAYFASEFQTFASGTWVALVKPRSQNDAHWNTKELLKCTKNTSYKSSEKLFTWSMKKSLYAILYHCLPYISIFAPSLSLSHFSLNERKRWLSWNSRGADSISTELQQATGTVHRLSSPTHVHHAGVCKRVPAWSP